MIAAAYALFSYQDSNKELSNDREQTPPLAATLENNTDSAYSVENSLISTSPENAAVFIIEPSDGAVVSSPVTIKFGVSNMVIAPAGKNIENSGHHHLLLNLDTLPDLSLPLPATDRIIHFGKGQTQTTVNLEPGINSLQLLLGNYLHIPHDKPVLSKKITVTVQ